MDTQVLIKGVSEMPISELERFIQELNTLLTQRRRTEQPYRERYLLSLINQTVLGKEKTERYKTLILKHEYETISDEEHAELLTLAEEEEEIRVNRLTYLVELAQLQNIPLTLLMENLGLINPSHV